MIKIGHSAAPYRETVNEIGDIADIGLDFVEISMEPPNAAPDLLLKNAEKIAKRLQKKKLFATAHAPHWIELGSLELVERASWIAEVRKMIDVSEKIGVHGIVIHLNADMSDSASRKQSYENLAESFAFLLDYGRKRGVKLFPENTREDPKEFAKFMDSVPGLTMCLDIGHAFLHGGMDGVKKYIELLGSRIEHIQISDNNGNSDAHEPLGAGKIPWEKVVHLLKKAGYSRSITLEIFGHSRSVVKKSADYLKKLWGE